MQPLKIRLILVLKNLSYNQFGLNGFVLKNILVKWICVIKHLSQMTVRQQFQATFKSMILLNNENQRFIRFGWILFKVLWNGKFQKLRLFNRKEKNVRKIYINGVKINFVICAWKIGFFFIFFGHWCYEKSMDFYMFQHFLIYRILVN